MQLLNFTIIKLTICLIIGIVLAYFIKIPLGTSFYLTLILLLVLGLNYFIEKKQFIKTIWFGISSFLTMICMGILITNLHNQKNLDNHYSQHITDPENNLTVLFRIREVLKPSKYQTKYIVDILKVNNAEVSGKSLLNLAYDSEEPNLKVDDIYITNTTFKAINQPLDPGQFNYKRYLKNKYVYHQLSLNQKTLLKINSEAYTLIGYAHRVREYINSKLKPFHFKSQELAVINALFLGQRQHIDKEIYSDYVSAGAIHILAVSGLHVGILLAFLSSLLKPIEKVTNGKLIKTILLILLLWSFAVIAGLSASVTRAVTMFSIVAIALNIKRPTNSYNTLAISMFIVLLFKPLFIFDVGFQLSYAAVFAIVSIDPILYKLWKPKHKIVDVYWHTFTIGISAQLGILPLSLYYFHQFPGLFFVSNLVILPLLGFILAFGVIIILLASLNILPQFLSSTFGFLIDSMNQLMHWIAGKETYIFKDISFSILYVLATYLFIITSIKLYLKKDFKTLCFFLLSILFIQASVLFTNYQSTGSQFIIFHKNRNSLIGRVNNNKIIVSHDLDSLMFSKNVIIKNYAIDNQISSIGNENIQPVYLLKDKAVLIIDSLGIYNLKSINPDLVVLRQSPKINLDRLIDSIQPKVIIADGSNYKSYVEHWEAICRKRKLPFYPTNKKGAFILNY